MPPLRAGLILWEAHAKPAKPRGAGAPYNTLMFDQIITNGKLRIRYIFSSCKSKGSPYSITERRVSELIPVLGSQSAGDVSHKPGGRLPLLCARPAVTLATLKRAATNFAAW